MGPRSLFVGPVVLVLACAVQGILCVDGVLASSPGDTTQSLVRREERSSRAEEVRILKNPNPAVYLTCPSYHGRVSADSEDKISVFMS